MGAAQGKISRSEVADGKNKVAESDDTLAQVEVEAGSNTMEEEEEAPTKTVRKLTPEDVKTAPFDIRFPATNQTKHCYTRYCEFYKCQKDKGEGAPDCQKYKRYYRSLCPMEWVETWDEQRANGTFPGPY